MFFFRDFIAACALELRPLSLEPVIRHAVFPSA
jgi:hypothetical protein